MTYFNYNGKILPESTTIAGADSRALKYGDGLFETLKLKNGHLILADDHFARLWKGMYILKFEIPRLLTPEQLEAEIIALALKNRLVNCRVRVTIYRGDGGLYDPVNMLPKYIIQNWALPEQNAKLNVNGLEVCIYKDIRKSYDLLSGLKHNNFLLYIMAALYAKSQKCNDALVLNSNSMLCDSTIANIFLIKNNIIYTPALSEGCIAGVMRKFLISVLPLLGIKIREASLSVDDLLDADEVFLSNSIYNIRWVASFENKKYKNEVILELDRQLRQTNAGVFC